MASTDDYNKYVLDLLSPLGDVSSRKMMGEYLLYYRGKLFGGIYDNRLLLKTTPSASGAFHESVLPYDGSKQPMLVVDTENSELVCGVISKMYDELPEKKSK